MIKPKQYQAKVKTVNWLNPKYLEVTLNDFNHKDFEFLPGQFFNLKVSDVKYRPYSIASDYKTTTEFKFVASVLHNGVGANYLKSLKVGDEVSLIGPAGKFTFNSINTSVKFIVTGTGIAPIISMLYKIQEERYKKPVELLFGIRKESELFYLDLLDKFTKTIPDFKYKVFISQPENWNGLIGRITSHLEADNECDYYLCGNPDMIEDTVRILCESGVNESSIFMEKFTVNKVSAECTTKSI